MPSFPPPGSITICEINRDLVTADSYSDDRAKETYGKILGMVFSPVTFDATQLLQPSSEETTTVEQDGRRSGFFDNLKTRYVHLLPEIHTQGVSWHQHKHILAFISGHSQVTIRDYEDLSQEGDPSILSSECQRDVKVIEWRPNGGKTLAVACKGGICIWAASYPGNAPVMRFGATSSLGTLSRGSGTRWTLVDFLQDQYDEQITALSWSPDGRYLASASYVFSINSSFTIWDVSEGKGTPIRRGIGPISYLKWSPTGDYFFTAKFDGKFYLWETETWTSEQWSSSSGFVTGAAWDPEGRIILISFSGSSTLGSVHFASRPPSLDAHLIPVDLSGIVSLTGSLGIEKIAWDASGERLAVSYKEGDDNYKGLVAIYDVKRSPLISTSLIGFIKGPGENPKATGFAFHNKFKEGPLLSVVRLLKFIGIFSFYLSLTFYLFTENTSTHTFLLM